MQIATFVLSVAALVLSVIALTWQMVEHRLTGSRVRADLRLGGLGFGGVVTGPLDMNRSTLASQGVQEWVLCIDVRNIGRMAMDLTNFEIEFESGGAYNRAGWHLNPELPYRLESGSSKAFYVPLDDVEKALSMMGQGHAIRGRVRLANGSTTFTDWVELS